MSFSPSRLNVPGAVPRFGSSVMNGSSCSQNHHHHFRRTAGLKSSQNRRPRRATKRASATTIFCTSFQQRDLCEGDEGEDVEILQRDLVEEGLLDQKHANGYVAFLDIFLFFFPLDFFFFVVCCLLSLLQISVYENAKRTFKSLSTCI